MDGDIKIEDLIQRIDSMQEEIASLRESIDGRTPENRSFDIDRIKSLLQDGFSKITEAVGPAMDGVKVKLASPAKAVATSVEEKIAAHPLTSVAIALGAGLVIGKAVSSACRCTRRKD
jgi:ElaB/YqjD/DUF883 family membrane-anchored ribosome-binding protein